MTASWPEGNRDVIPRWRSPQETAAQGETDTLTQAAPRELDRRSREEREREWQEHRSLGFATDLVGTALLVGASPAAREAAEFVLDPESGASDLARAVAREVVGTDDGEVPLLSQPTAFEVRAEIHDLKHRLSNDPRNTLAWTEISRYYTILGQRDQASRAMKFALGLSPDHRYVLRAAARLGVHHGEFDRAHALVAGAAATAADPWLVAAEIATAGPAGARSRFIKHGLQMLKGDKFSDHSISELASALGTLEFRDGTARKARRLFERSLVSPNDNAIAQGEWISRELTTVTVEPTLLDESAEARALRYAEETEWKEALGAAWEWHRDQPFASGPGELGSYQAALGRSYEEGARIAEAALTANPGEFLLNNNLVFCLVNMDEVEVAVERFQEIDPETLSEEQRPTYLATAGLLAFRTGDPDAGRAFYAESIRRAGDRRHELLATIMLAGEELRLRSPAADELVKEVTAAGEKTGERDIALWLKHLPEPTRIGK